MKKLVLSSLIVLSSVMAFADANKVLATESAKSKALMLILKSSAEMRASGDLNKGESIAPILDNVKNWLADSMVDMMSPGQRPSSESNIKKVTIECKHVAAEYATCMMNIDYKLLGNTGISYSITLDRFDEPVALTSSYADVSRGD